MAHIIDLLRQRVSVRNFQAKPVPQSVLDDILEAGRLSPSGGNEQAYRFGVITDPDQIARIARLAYHQEWIAQAPLLIVLCTAFVADACGGRNIQLQRFPESAGVFAALDAEIYHALNQEEHQTKIAGTHMVLAALEHGVGACWVSRFEVKPVADLLRLPPGVQPGEILVFGYPARQRSTTPKKSLEELVFFNAWEES